MLHQHSLAVQVGCVCGKLGGVRGLCVCVFAFLFVCVCAGVFVRVYL